MGVEGTGTGSDAVQRPLEVEAEGLVQERTTNAVLDPSEPAGEAVQFETSFPQEAVEGSARASVSIVGDLLGPTLDGLERLVRLPTGCGEQTMITFAPQVYVRVSNGNRDVVQRLELPLGQRFRASAEGTGQVAFPSTVEFNVLEMAEEPRFDFSVAWSAAPAVAASRKMRARVEPLGGGKGGMAVMELGLFTGTAVTAGSLAALRADRRVKRLEVEPTKLVLYFDEVLGGETIELEAETVSPVANLQPTSSIVYEYYQPENQALAISRSDAAPELLSGR